MKKNLILFLFLIASFSIGGFFYLYKGHRDIANEKEDFTVTANAIISEFQINENKANSKYLDKTIEISGRMTSIDFKTKSMVIDEKLFATFADTIPKNLNVNSAIKVKGRFVGFDGLLEEMKIDQCVIITQ